MRRATEQSEHTFSNRDTIRPQLDAEVEQKPITLEREFNALVQYLEVGEILDCTNEYWYSRPVVERNKLRRLLLEAGFVDLAFSDWFGTHFFINPDQKPKEHTNDLCLVRRRHEEDIQQNHIWMRMPELYAEIKTLDIQTLQPQTRSYKERERALAVFDRLKEVAKQLQRQGKGISSLSRWENIDDTAELWFWLNPHDYQQYDFGWYTIEELELWLYDLGPVIQGNQDVLNQADEFLDSHRTVKTDADKIIVRLFLRVFQQHVERYLREVLKNKKLLGHTPTAKPAEKESLIGLLNDHQFFPPNDTEALGEASLRLFRYGLGAQEFDQQTIIALFDAFSNAVAYWATRVQEHTAFLGLSKN